MASCCLPGEDADVALLVIGGALISLFVLCDSLPTDDVAPASCAAPPSLLFVLDEGRALEYPPLPLLPLLLDDRFEYGLATAGDCCCCFLE